MTFKKILIIIASLISIFLLFYVGQIIYQRNFIDNNSVKNQEHLEEESLEELKNRPSLNSEIKPPIINQKPTENTEKQIENERLSQLKISTEDCNNECQNFKKNNLKDTENSDLTYCLQVCGLFYEKDESDENINNTGNNSTENNNLEEKNEIKNCEDLTNLEQDYCWRDQAIAEKDFSKCEKIQDANIFQQCKNRIMEDFIDNQE
jgi:hypothetical protein